MKTGLKWHLMMRANKMLFAGIFALVLATTNNAAVAQSQYGCRALGSLPQPMVEGADGVFFQTDPDLVMYNRLSQPVVDQIAELSQELQAQGSTLIVSLIPTKSLAMPEALSANTIVYGYENRVSSQIYQGNLDRLAQADVAVVNARNAFLSHTPKRKAFFETDGRVTNIGLRALATATSNELFTHAAYGPSPKATFVTTTGDEFQLLSEQHEALQELCQDKLPKPVARQETTNRIQTDIDIPLIALVTTEVTGSPDLNYAGFLSEKTGFDVAHFSVEGSAMDAMASYLTSDDFVRDQPEFIVWNIPTWHNLAIFGDQPMREARAAASRNCTTQINMAVTDVGSAEIDFSGVSISPDQTLLVVLDQPDNRVDFAFSHQNGMQRVRSVLRKETQPQSRRFYMPLTGLWADQTTGVTITAGSKVITGAAAFLCGLNS